MKEVQPAARKVISHYRIISRVGAGGMGEVYLAEDTLLDRRVAIKFLPPESTADEQAGKRLVREAHAAANLDHPNICSIYEVGQDAGHTFIVMQYVEGVTLAAHLGRRSMELQESLAIAIQIAEALAEAHSRRIIHRDIKPQNIMITSRGQVKVMDFGLAKSVTAEMSTESEGETQSLLTEPGTILGTVPYMSPEQVRGEQLDARSDIFSFGTVMYEMVSGHHPFAAENPATTMSAILTRDPQLLGRYLREAPAELERIVAKSLRKNREERYQVMKDLALDLKSLKDELEFEAKLQRSVSPDASSAARVAVSESIKAFDTAGQAAVPSDKIEVAHTTSTTKDIVNEIKRHKRAAGVTLAAVIITAAAGLFYLVWRPWLPGPPAEPLRAVPLTTLPGIEHSPSLSPDGNYVVFVWADPKQGNQDIYVQQIGSGTPVQRTTDSLDDYNPVWSPDGRWVAFFRSQPPAPTGLRSRELRLIPPLGGPERKLADIRGQDFPDAVYLAWSSDSNSLVVTDSVGEGQPDALFVISPDTGEKRQLTNPQPPVLADTSPAVSADGLSLVFLRRTTWGAGELELLPLGKGLTAAGQPKRLTPAELRADHPAWMPDGKEIIFSAKGSLWRMTVTVESTPTRIPYVGEDGLMPAIARAQAGKPARLVYVHSVNDSNFWRIDTSDPGAPSTSAPAMAISSTKWEYHCRFSPDGRRVAFASERSGEKEIWVSDPDGSNAVKLTSMGAQETMFPYWSPDGQFIAFSSNPEGELDIYVVSVAGGKPRRLTSHPGIDLCPTFSLDGKWIYFGSMRSGDYRVWKMPASGGEALQVTPNQGGAGAIESTDGSSLYYNSVAVVGSVWRLPISGSEPIKVLDGVVWFNYCVAEKGIYYIDRLGDENRLQYLNFVTGKSTTVARNLGEVSAGLTATPDGRTILFTRVDSSVDDLMLVENFR